MLKTKRLLAFLLVLTAGLCEAQDLNNFKYVIVENQYDFQQEPNEYRLNEMMVFEIKKRGLHAFRNSDVLPKDLNIGTCNALNLRAIVSRGLRVKMTYEFVNCTGEVVYTTQEGIGRTKNYEKAYREALRDAMKSLDEVDYTYEKPEYIKIVQGAPVDSVRTRSGRPGQRDLKKEKIILSDNQQIGTVNTISMSSKDGLFTLKFEDEKINIFKNNNLIGTLKKSQSGCYLAITTEFTGIGYEKDGGFIIEYDKNGTQFLIFNK